MRVPELIISTLDGVDGDWYSGLYEHGALTPTKSLSGKFTKEILAEWSARLGFMDTPGRSLADAIKLHRNEGGTVTVFPVERIANAHSS